jgi:hypothetical protein
LNLFNNRLDNNSFKNNISINSNTDLKQETSILKLLENKRKKSYRDEDEEEMDEE